jgi:hypothetical protein
LTGTPQIRVYDSNSNFFSISFGSYGRANVSWAAVDDTKAKSESGILNVYDYSGTINHFTLSYDGQAGTFTVDTGAPKNFHKVYNANVAPDFKASSVYITSNASSNATYSAPQIMVDNVKLTTVPEPTTLGLLGAGTGLVLLKRSRR